MVELAFGFEVLLGEVGFVGGLVGDGVPEDIGDDGDSHPGFEVGLVEAGEDAVGSVGFKIGVDVLIVVVLEGDAADSIFVESVGVHDRDSVPPLLQVLLGDEDEVFGGLGHEPFRVGDHVLEDLSLEVQLKFCEVNVFEVEGDLGESVVEFGLLENEVEVVGDAVFADD